MNSSFLICFSYQLNIIWKGFYFIEKTAHELIYSPPTPTRQFRAPFLFTLTKNERNDENEEIFKFVY